MKFGWIDLRFVPAEHSESIVDAAIHAGLAGLVDDKPNVLTTLPPTVRKVYLPGDGERPSADVADMVLEPLSTQAELDALQLRAD